MHNVARTPAPATPLEETGRMPALFDRDGSTPTEPEAAPQGPDYDLIQRSPEFRTLRTRFRRFVFPMSVAFLLWYLLYVVLAAYATDFMATPVFGLVNVGMLLGLAQFVTTALITWLYTRFAERQIDPRVAELRERAAVTEGKPL
ncbi:DUF485 domain-containing protein [Amycolatopsis jiangsuensis]|uniref:Uncharacterized membrane protein (DUF485 family) n=1 Tax=Amycolatopsis jiangsuensis TaxID=1181879 RepID=A0A840ITW6_9PSEU|nr:DUF485 domain-containing protein [Amycolatopsis jiangsuensis]MBB4684895.1 uncharacterized membrane protein (DUF485 family) [Amycolatopsis jiangsuensis]